MSLQDKLISVLPLPDSVYRWGIRKQLKDRLLEESGRYKSDHIYAEALRKQAITIHTKEANSQHYEVPTAFYQLVMGDALKYSCGYWEAETTDLNTSELDMLALYVRRANLKNGQRILDLGCGWGSFSLYAAETFPDAEIVGVSNSQTQRRYIETEIKKRKLSNLRIITTDVSQLELSETFDRIVSIEMLEHVRNYADLFKKIASWLADNGQFFAHIFGHKSLAYEFDTHQSKSWMAEHFFTGGQMPSKHLFSEFQDDLQLKEQWTVSGDHYAKTCRMWLNNMDQNKNKIRPIFKETYGKHDRKFWTYWRLFFMACEELFAFSDGNEWQVYHYLFEKGAH